MTTRVLTAAEAISAIVVVTLSAIILAAYALARVGLAIQPAIVLMAGLACALIAIWRLRRHAAFDWADLAWWLAIVVAIAAWLLWLSWPSLLPIGTGPDLTHHLLLVGYIERQWTLPDASLGHFLGEMAHYTPGLHLLAALAGAWIGRDGLHAVHPLMAVSVALKAGFIFLIARRLLPDDAARVPLALLAVVLLFLPQSYFLGGFTWDSFLAQVMSELFAVAMWWAVVVWDQTRRRTAVVLFAVAGIAAFLTWPVWVGPPILALCAVGVVHEDRRLRDVAIAILPIIAIAAVHAFGRVGWFGMAGTSGAVLQPSFEAFGWPFLVVSIGGLAVAITRETRTVALMAAAIGLQSLALLALAVARGATTPYMAFKMFYLLIYPLAVAGVLGVAFLLQAIARRWPSAPRSAALAWILLAIVLAGVGRGVARAPLPERAVSDDLYQAGLWARANVPGECVDYLVPNQYTSYWLHLAVLGNPRASARTIDDRTFMFKQTLSRWVAGQGLPYAIADLSLLPQEVREQVDVLSQFGEIAVIRTRGPSSCSDAVAATRPG